MKKTTLFILLFTIFFSVSPKAQTVKDDVSYLKITNYLWYTTNLFKDLKGEQTLEKRDKILPIVKKVVKCSRSEFNNLKANHPSDPYLEKIEKWISAEEQNIIGIEGAAWKTQPMWQMGYYLVQLELEDLINKELCK